MIKVQLILEIGDKFSDNEFSEVNNIEKVRIKIANPAAFGATEKNAVTVVGDPS